ncbi:tRNA (N6-threonylcarbamoyladenosine(37)-N6)-methyltransferase TrmO [Opitutaceae bacterium TAV4]|nr:tRNA (N6-threonylcarbamoyladenosine(37)-N6)-methyltransferase TrmO [Opitutaceae bacterium TAV4]RRK01154.1 tRNA (N6-threonylcarbamoyladenosine(37)-N6)-methyltransferase TrmO [Opitutaceae bacterium TAV3]
MRAVATLRTPFAEKFGVPRQSGLIEEAEARVEFAPEFARADFVRGLEAFSHVWLVTWFHQSPAWKGAATVRPPRLGGNDRVGVFASRSPNRPNPIGLSLVRLLSIETEPTLILRVAGIDAVDGTPVLDVKPYLPWCEALPDARADWAGGAPQVRDANAVLIAPEFAARFLRGPATTDPDAPAVRDGNNTEAGARTLALIRHLLQLDLQPAYQREEGREYGMTIAGWNIRWRALSGGRVEVIDATRAG